MRIRAGERWKRRFALVRIIWIAWVMFAVCPAAFAQSESQTPVGPSPVVRINVRGGPLTIRTWNLPAVKIDGKAGLGVTLRGRMGGNPGMVVPVLAQTTAPIFGSITLPAESFVVAVQPGEHTRAMITGGGGAATVTVPSSTAVLIVNMQRGRLVLDGLRGTTFVARVRRGRIDMRDVSGEGFVQVLNGSVHAAGSSFERLRVRTGTGNIVLEHCTARQIEASSVAGSIVFDSGTFTPGIAHFESERGDVAIGLAAGGAQFALASRADNVYRNFTHVPVSERGGELIVNGGGPVVTANAGRGIFLYDRNLRDIPKLDAPWRELRATLQGL